jgi:gp16 family phage-associated protein
MISIYRVRQSFKARGITVRSWAVDNGFKPSIVYAVLGGRVRGNWGEAHKVCVALNLKPKIDEFLLDGEAESMNSENEGSSM